jgi:acyl-CoA thioester hydrolase
MAGPEQFLVPTEVALPMSIQEKPPELENFPLVVEIPVHWGDQDAFGHVNNAIPLKWFESARVSYLDQAGLGYLMNGGELSPIVASLTCHYRRQVKFPDCMQIGIRVASMRRSSVLMQQIAYNKNRSQVAVEGTAVIVFFDYIAQRPRRVTPVIKTLMERLEGHPFTFDIGSAFTE